VVWPGRFAPLLVAAAGWLRICFALALQDRSAAVCLCFGDYCLGAGFLSADSKFCCAPVRRHAGRASCRRHGIESSSSISRDGDSSAHALFGIRRLHRSLCLRAGCAHHEVSRREMDSDHAPLDHGDLVLPDHRRLPRRALGLRRPRLGRLLGMGPGGKCLTNAVAHRHRISAFRHNAGKTRHVEGVEYVADLRYFSALDAGHVSYPLGCDQFGARFRAILDRDVVPRIHRIDARGLQLFPGGEPLASQERAQTGVAGLA